MAARNLLKTNQEILSLFTSAFQEVPDTPRQIHEKTWLRNILYYLGEQWFHWYESQATFRRRYALDPDVPTPVFNIIRDHVRSSKALVLNKKYATAVWPNSNEEKDKNGAKLGGKILEWLDSLHDGDIQDVKEWTVIWMILTGNGFTRAFPDKDTGKFVVNESTGKVIESPVGVGAVSLSPFNIIFPTLGTKMEDKKYVGIKTLVEREWAEDTFKILLGGSSDSQLVEYEKQLLTLVANVSPWKGRGLPSGVTDLDTRDLVVLKELEVRPTKDHPKGCHFISIDGKVTFREENLPIPTAKDGSWNYSITHYPLNHVPGSFLATGSVDDLISPQNNINEIDQALAVNRKTIGRPWVLTPSNVILRRISERGIGLNNLTYDARTSMGARPVIQAGMPYPSQILDERANHRTAAQDTSGDPKNVLRGGTPHANASGVLVDILRESAEQSHSPDIERFYRNWNKFNRKRLLVAQHVVRETRKLKIMGEGSKVEVATFRGTDLNNNTDVRCELDSGLSSTNAGRNELLLRAAQYGVFGDLAQDPGMRRNLQKRMGLSGMETTKENLHEARAERENLRLRTGDVERIALPNTTMPSPVNGQPILDHNGRPIMMFPKAGFDPLFVHDPHEIHIFIHEQDIFSKEFEEWPAESQMMALAHRDLHIAAMQQKQQENIAAATPPELTQPAPQGQPGPQPGGIGKMLAAQVVGGGRQ